MICKDCLSEKVCKYKDRPIPLGDCTYEESNDVEKSGCPFKNKANYVELPCKIGDTVWYISTENPFVAFEKELKAREDPEPISGILITKDGLYVITGDIKEVVNLCDKVNEDYAYLSKEEADREAEKGRWKC